MYGPLVQTLKRMDRVPTAAEAPTPSELGVACYDGELTPDILFSIGRALHRWELELEDEFHRRPAKRRKREAVLRDRRESALLRSRLALVRRRQKELAAGLEPIGAPYFLDELAETELQALLDEAARTHGLAPMVRWQARVVYWLSGLCAAKRFLAAYDTASELYPAAVRRDPLVSFRAAAEVWVQRVETANWRALLAEIIERIRRLPSEAARSAALTHRRQGGKVRGICETILNRCDRYLHEEDVRLTTKLPAELAALTAADRSQVPIPSSCFEHDPNHDFFAAARKKLKTLGALVGRRGYDQLLSVIAGKSHPLTTHNFGDFCDLIDRGADTDDALWACEQNLQAYLRISSLNVRIYRRVAGEFERRGYRLDDYELRNLVRHVLRPEHLEPLRAWLAWLGSVSPRALTDAVRSRLIPMLFDTYLPIALRPERFARIVAAITPTSRRAHAGDFGPLLERIVAYRSGSGVAAQLPKSLRKLIEFTDTRRREQEYLAEREAAGNLDDSARARLDYLRRSVVTPPRGDKILREAEELFLQFGFNALLAVARAMAIEDCGNELPDLPAELTTRRCGDFARWIGGMDESQRKMLREIKEAHRRHGRAYKRKLGENREWIIKAAARGVNLEVWFEAPPEQVVVVGRTMELTITPDLYDLFQMGSYFNTCLSLGGINEFSVLTNAYDANKQVLYLYERDEHGRRRVVGRKIMAVTSDFKLLGYSWYFEHRVIDGDRFSEACQAVGTHVGRFAARCGFTLVDEGEPETIADHAWYDDGPMEWPASATAACLLENRASEVEEIATC